MILNKIVAALPERTISSEEIAARCGSDAKFLIKKAGIKARRFLAASEDEFLLVSKAAQKLLRGINPKDIGLCIVVGQVKAQIIPHASALLQAKLELPESCLCFDLGLACSGYVHALCVASALMRSQGIAKGIIVTCDPYSRILDMSDRATAPLFGDAATATLLSDSGSGISLGKGDFGTDGAGAQYISCNYGGQLRMDGRGIFNFAMRRVPHSVDRTLELNGKKRKDINYFIFHQANAFIIEQLRNSMGIPEEKCPIALSHLGNTVSSSIPLALAGLNFKDEDELILSGFGAGLSWGSIYGKVSGFWQGEDSDFLK